MSLQTRIHGGIEVDEQTALSLHERVAPALPVRPLDRFEQLRATIHRACVARIGPELQALESTPDELLARVREVAETELASSGERLAAEERELLFGRVVDDVLGLGPLEPYLRDPTVSEVMVNGHERIYVERGGRLEEVDARFADEEHLLRVIERIVSAVGRRVDEASPMVDARLPDGSRVNAVLPPVALTGPALTIRKFSRSIYGMDDLVSLGTVSGEAAEFLRLCVRGKLNVLVSGGTGVGKTTLLNALSGFIPDAERIVTIEDAAELQLQQRHVVSLEQRPPNAEGKGEIRIRELVRNALRMRPDRIVVGEVRGGETLDMLQAMNTGHEGSLTTIHANSARDALSRLETLVLTAGIDLPLRAIREQIASAFDVLVQVARLVDGSRRVTEITEVLRLESDVVALQELYVARPERGDGAQLLGPLRATGLQPHFLDKLAAAGVELPSRLFDPEPPPVRRPARSAGRAA
ncbi:MAG TPA: CpaF family protein [Gaiellaceae bacterium]